MSLLIIILPACAHLPTWNALQGLGMGPPRCVGCWCMLDKPFFDHKERLHSRRCLVASLFYLVSSSLCILQLDSRFADVRGPSSLPQLLLFLTPLQITARVSISLPAWGSPGRGSRGALGRAGSWQLAPAFPVSWKSYLDKGELTRKNSLTQKIGTEFRPLGQPHNSS